MTHKHPTPRIDERLERLLEVERHIERRIQAAEGAARERAARAREAAARVDEERSAHLEREAARQEREELERHADELSRIAGEARARVAALEAVTEETVDALARRALARAIGDGGGP